MGIILEAQSISKQFGAKKVVKNVDLSINNGEFIAFLGPNGAGKSTMIQLLTTLIPASSGQIKIKGINIQKNKKQLRKNIGIVFQQSILDYDLTVLQNLQLSQQLVHANQRYFNKIVELFKLTNILQQKIATLSGGQRRRVDIAYVLLGQPAILFLDEPTNALDLQTRQLIWRILNDLKQKENMTIFLTTHYLMEAEQADQVYIFDHGEILAHGSVNELENNYANNYLTVFDPNFIAPNHWVKSGQRFLIKNVFEMLDELQKQDIKTFSYQPTTLDDVYVSLTGQEVRI